jgi:hypothetical protein
VRLVQEFGAHEWPPGDAHESPNEGQMLPNLLTRSRHWDDSAGQIWWLSTSMPQFHGSAAVGWKHGMLLDGRAES